MAFKRLLVRRDTAANWTSTNPTLASGEFGYETNTGKFKIGNGSTAWTSLAYSIDTNIGFASLNSLSDVTITSAANGDFLRWNGTVWINDAVNLSTDTIGSYVESLVAGTGVTLTNNSGEGATPTVAVNTSVIAPIESPTFTGTVSGVTKSMVGLGSVDNTSDASKPVSTATQTALDLKAPLASPTFTGTVAGITSTMVGLGNVNNTSDANKPVSTATQTALDLKAPLASPTFTGTATTNDLTVSGNLTVSGTTTSINTETLTVNDNIVVLNNNATGAPTENAGIEVERGSSTNVALRWNETSDAWELTNDGTTYEEIATTTDVSTADNLKADLASPTFTGTVSLPTTTSIGDVSSTEIGYLDGVTSAIQTQFSAKAPLVSSITTVADASYALVLADAYKYISFTNASAVTLSVPLNSGVAFAVNDWIDFTTTTSPLVISPAAGVTINKSIGQWLVVLPNQRARLTKTATNTWHLVVSSFPGSFIEPILIDATGATGTINIDFASNASILRTGNATGNFVLNVRGTPTTTMNDIMAVGEVATVSFMATMGSTPYYATAYQVDGVAITPKWQGGTAVTAGQASSINMYTITLVKTGSATYTSFASMTKFA